MTKTVFFGPFVGELGWELLYWQGWVRRVCLEDFREYRKIAASVPGREPFYPYVDEFWPLPEKFLRLRTSGCSYITDAWRGGYPGLQREVSAPRTLRERLLRRRPSTIWTMEPLDGPAIEPIAEQMLADFSKRLPADTTYFVPWRRNRYEPESVDFGIDLPAGMLPKWPAFQPLTLPLHVQRKEHIVPTAAGRQAYLRHNARDRSLISVFPRCRSTRRPDKNWSADNYRQLIAELQRTYPGHQVAVVGEPGGAYFSDGVPDGCLDLVNVEASRRLDIHAAAMQRSVFCVGGMSGALSFAMAAGCPTVMWGFDYHLHTYTWANYMCTPFVYHQEIDPAVEKVIGLVDAFARMIETHGRRVAAGD